MFLEGLINHEIRGIIEKYLKGFMKNRVLVIVFLIFSVTILNIENIEGVFLKNDFFYTFSKFKR